MSLKNCYMRSGGDFNEVLGRLRCEQTVQKLVYKFLDDKSFSLFEASMGDKDYTETLRAVHALKGICQNLSFIGLLENSSLVTIASGEDDWDKALDMIPQLSKDYHAIIDTIEKLKISKEE